MAQAPVGTVTLAGVQGGSVTAPCLGCSPIEFRSLSSFQSIIGSPYIVWQEAAMLPGAVTLTLHVASKAIYDGFRTVCRPRSTVTVSSTDCPGLWLSGKCGVIRMSFSQWSPAHRVYKVDLELQILSDAPA